jgi:hypothetical protein
MVSCVCAGLYGRCKEMFPADAVERLVDGMHCLCWWRVWCEVVSGSAAVVMRVCQSHAGLRRLVFLGGATPFCRHHCLVHAVCV